MATRRQTQAATRNLKKARSKMGKWDLIRAIRRSS
jgi:hypothetical protein